MMITRSVSEWEIFLGKQIKNARIRKNMTQQELSARAGISLPTIGRLEGGRGGSLSNFIKVLQIIGEENWLSSLAPEVTISPIQMKSLNKQRERASRRTKGE
jgi:transcriptional regulator with XRE-family HTH domain